MKREDAASIRIVVRAILLFSAFADFELKPRNAVIIEKVIIKITLKLLFFFLTDTIWTFINLEALANALTLSSAAAFYLSAEATG
ncbi:MAG: hypothetical protein R2941_09265 [Desulfobacterales bacterium]